MSVESTTMEQRIEMLMNMLLGLRQPGEPLDPRDAKFWICLSLTNYAWVVFPEGSHFMCALHIPQSDDFAVFCSDETADDAKQRINNLVPTEMQKWYPCSSRDHAVALLHFFELTGYHLRWGGFHRGLWKNAPFTGKTTPPGISNKLGLRYGHPTEKWPASETISIWAGAAHVLDTAINDPTLANNTNLLDNLHVKESINMFCRPLIGRNQPQGLLAYLNTSFRKHQPLLELWMKIIRKIRNNRIAHLPDKRFVLDRFGIQECIATRTLISQAKVAWEQANVPIPEQVYDIPADDVVNLGLAVAVNTKRQDLTTTLGDTFQDAISILRVRECFENGNHTEMSKELLSLGARYVLKYNRRVEHSQDVVREVLHGEKQDAFIRAYQHYKQAGDSNPAQSALESIHIWSTQT